MFRIVLAVALSVSLSLAMLGCSGDGSVKTSSAGAKKPAEKVLARIDPKKEKGLVSDEGELSVMLTVKNKTKSKITLHWLDETDGSRVYYKEIPAGGEILQGTYKGHYWLILDKAGKPLGIYKTTENDGVIIVK